MNTYLMFFTLLTITTQPTLYAMNRIRYQARLFALNLLNKIPPNITISTRKFTYTLSTKRTVTAGTSIAGGITAWNFLPET